MSDKKDKEPISAIKVPACPFCGDFNTLETGRVKVYDVFHNSCTWVSYLCMRCDRKFRKLV